jgi:chaperonin GroEL (HSP60 family)
MYEAGIVDASSIVLGAIRNALGIASTLLTTSSVIVLPPEKEKKDSPFPFN